MKVNLGEIYSFLASYKGLPFPKDVKDYLPFKKEQWSNRVGLLTGKTSFSSLYGVPVIVPVVLGGVKLGSGEEGSINLQPMVMYEGTKNIVSTVIAGGSYEGTVKEFINIGDYRIRIYGVIANPNQKEYPTDQLQILIDLWQKNEAITFECELTERLFQHVVIRDIKLDALTRSPGLQAYEIQAISDGILEAELLREG
jgi:hypothetical protein